MRQPQRRSPVVVLGCAVRRLRCAVAPSVAPTGSGKPLPTGQRAGTLGALGGTRPLNLQIRRYPCGHPGPFRSGRNLGRLPICCSCQSGEPQGRSSPWLPAWLPRRAPSRPAIVLVPRRSPPIGLAAAALFAGGEVSRADSRGRRPGTFTCARCPAVRSALDAVPEAYHNPAAVWWGAIAAFAVIPDPIVMEPVTRR
jgi:hypothetical protein